MASSKAVVEDVAEPNMPNAAVKVAVLISKEIQCSADVKAIGLYRATFICFENSGCCIVSEMLSVWPCSILTVGGVLVGYFVYSMVKMDCWDSRTSLRCASNLT